MKKLLLCAAILSAHLVSNCSDDEGKSITDNIANPMTLIKRWRDVTLFKEVLVAYTASTNY